MSGTISSAYIAGVILGDGWCTGLTLGLRCKDKSFSSHFSHALESSTGTRIIPKRDERGYWLIRAGNKSHRFDFLKTIHPKLSSEKAAWLRGLFDSEGNAQIWHMPHVSENSYHRRIAFYSSNIDTLKRASRYLTDLNIIHSMRSTRNSSSHKGTKIIFELRIICREGFSRFAIAVGSSIPRKSAIISKIVSTYQEPSAYCSLGGRRGSLMRKDRAALGGKY